MGVDIKVLLEHKISNEWVLVDVDPVYSADRNSKRREELHKNKIEKPHDLSKGTSYWLDGDNGLNYITCLGINEAVEIWNQTEKEVLEFKSALVTYFGLWEPDVNKWRVIVAI